MVARQDFLGTMQELPGGTEHWQSCEETRKPTEISFCR